MTLRNRAARCCVAFGLFGLASWAQARMPLELSAGIYRILAEVANTDASREQGLMYRKSMASNSGMLFVFDQAAQYCMWMRNTRIPLSVAFLDRNGHIINVEEMLPLTENNHCAAKPAKFALEMNAGWFSARGLRVGMAISGIEEAPAAH